MNTSLVLRVCESDFSSRNGFVWPAEIGAIATCPDFVDSNECGNGLHGWLNGIGDSSASNLVDAINAKWLVLEVETDKIIDLKGKVKFPSAKVIFIGSRGECADYIYDRVPDCPNIIGLDKNGGDYSTLTCGGDYSTLTGGYKSTLTGGNYSTLTGGNYSTLTGRHKSTLTGGYNSTLTGGYKSTLTGGNNSTLTGGNYQNGKIKIKVAYVGEDGIEADVPYKLDANFNVVKSMA